MSDTPADLPRFTWGGVFTDWGIDPFPFVLTIWVAGLYLLGVWVLRRRGDAWPWGRTLAFVGVGMGSFFVATASGIGRYDTTLLSVHMVQHMILSMVVPLALALDPRHADRERRQSKHDGRRERPAQRSEPDLDDALPHDVVIGKVGFVLCARPEAEDEAEGREDHQPE